MDNFVYIVTAEGHNGVDTITYKPDDLISLEYKTGYVDAKFTDGREVMWPMSSIIEVEKRPIE